MACGMRGEFIELIWSRRMMIDLPFPVESKLYSLIISIGFQLTGMRVYYKNI